LYFGLLTALLDSEDVREDIGKGLNELDVKAVGGVEGDGRRRTLRAAPEGQALIGLMLEREVVEELRDLVVEDLLELADSEREAIFELQALVGL